MRAAYRIHYGSPSVLSIREIDKPQPLADEIIIKVIATTVNRTDCAVLTGKPLIFRLFTGIPRPRHVSTGTDFAGIVEAVGSKVTNYKPGDRVWGFDDVNIGSHAEYLKINIKKAILPIPDKLSFEDAAASIEGAHYAYNSINKVDLKPGNNVLIYGASGAIGSAALQILKYFEVKVTAVCGTDAITKIEKLQPDHIIDYQKEDFTRDKGKYDLVVDAVGKSSFAICKPLLKPKGTYLSSELGANAQNLFLSLITPITGGQKVKFPLPTNILRTMKLLQKMFEAGKFTPVIDKSYSLDKIHEAFEFVMSGQKIGNVILKITTDNGK